MFFLLKKIYRGQSLLRILMNLGFRHHTLNGRVVDVGGGRSPDYFDYFKKTDTVSVEAIDTSLTKINFEKETLPYKDGSVDTVVLANVLEHIYNYRFLTSEIFRILKPTSGGQLIGFVPFLIQYHPDPHDFFRYTKESLRRILEEAGFQEVSIKEVGGGPFFANFNNLVLSVPRIVRVIIFPVYYLADKIFLKLRPKARERYPLGFIFLAKKV